MLARLGPMRSWIMALCLRSAQTRPGANIAMAIPSTIAILTKVDATMKPVSISGTCLCDAFADHLSCARPKRALIAMFEGDAGARRERGDHLGGRPDRGLRRNNDLEFADEAFKVHEAALGLKMHRDREHDISERGELGDMRIERDERHAL